MVAHTVNLPEEWAHAARALFCDRLVLAGRYAELLATEGVVRGLIGPREAPRIWERHLLNCSVLGELIPEGADVVDVGSGAGLPGLVLAVARPDLALTLVEPLARRTAFLTEVVEELGLHNVRVLRARAEEAAELLPPARIVTARAVAPLDRLAAWCLPLLAIDGRLLAMKGASAEEEVATHAGEVTRLGGGSVRVVRCGAALLEPPTTVVEVVRDRADVSTVRAGGVGATAQRKPRRGGRGSARRR